MALLTVGILLLSASLLQTRLLPRWYAVALALAAIAPFPLQEHGILAAGLLWLAMGIALVIRAQRHPAPAGL